MVRDDLNPQELMEKGWIKCWVMFEVQAIKKDVVENALKKHIEKLNKEDGLNILEENFTSVDKIEAPKQLQERGIKNLFTQVVEIIFLAKNFESLINMTINYGPTVIEILGPEKITLSMREAQNSLVSVADMMHKYTAAGFGGVIISGA